MKIFSCMFLAVLFMAPFTLQARNLTDQGPSPKTKLESLSAKTGVVIIRSFADIGSVSGLYSSSIEVEADEILNVSTGNKEYGIAVDVKKEDGDQKKSDTTYIDYDEIGPLIKGIDYIAKVHKSKTAFSNFEANYSTKGEFKISTFSIHEKIMVAVSSVGSKNVSAYYNLSSLPEIKALLQKAKDKIESLRDK